MVPGFLQGRYTEADLTIDLAALASASRGAALARPRPRRSTSASARCAAGAGGPLRRPVARRWLDSGRSRRPGRPGARGDPSGRMRQALALRGPGGHLGGAGPPRPRARDRRGSRGRRRRGGAGRPPAHPPRPVSRPEVTLVEAAASVLPGFEVPVRRRAAQILAGRGVAAALGSARSAAWRKTPSSSRTGRARRPIWSSGLPAPRAPCSSRRPASRSIPGASSSWTPRSRAADGAHVWPAGDCVTLADYPETPKAGVYAVRQGPVLARNLRAALGPGEARGVRPPADLPVAPQHRGRQGPAPVARDRQPLALRLVAQGPHRPPLRPPATAAPA